MYSKSKTRGKNQTALGADTWTPELQSRFQQIKDCSQTLHAGECRANPMALGEPGLGEYILITDYSKMEEMLGI